MANYVYVIQSGSDGAIKIGISKNPEQRLSQLQTSNPKELRILYAWQVEDATMLERHLHFVFAEYRLSGEWFKPENEIMDKLEFLNGVLSHTGKVDRIYIDRVEVQEVEVEVEKLVPFEEWQEWEDQQSAVSPELEAEIHDFLERAEGVIERGESRMSDYVVALRARYNVLSSRLADEVGYPSVILGSHTSYLDSRLDEAFKGLMNPGRTKQKRDAYRKYFGDDTQD